MCAISDAQQLLCKLCQAVRSDVQCTGARRSAQPDGVCWLQRAGGSFSFAVALLSQAQQSRAEQDAVRWVVHLLALARFLSVIVVLLERCAPKGDVPTADAKLVTAVQQAQLAEQCAQQSATLRALLAELQLPFLPPGVLPCAVWGELSAESIALFATQHQVSGDAVLVIDIRTLPQITDADGSRLCGETCTRV